MPWASSPGDARTLSDRVLSRVDQAPERGTVVVLGPTSGPDYAEALKAALTHPQREGVALVIVSFASSDMVAENLPSDLAAHAVQVVVVDNWSSGAERANARQLADANGWLLVEPTANLGFGEGVNAGVLAAAQLGYREFVTLNPDAVCTATTIVDLGRATAERPLALISPVVLRPDGTSFFTGSTIDVSRGRIRSGWIDGDADPVWKNWLSGACLAFSGGCFAALEGFAPEYFLYWEDVDLSRRAADLGMELVLRRDLSVGHDEGGTHGTTQGSGKSSLYYYYNTRNRLVFCAALAPQARGGWLATTPVESYRIWRRGGRRQLLTQPGGVWAALRGTVAGLRLALKRQRRVDIEV